MFFDLVQGNSKPEVTDFVLVSLVKDVCGLDISVEVASSVDIHVSDGELSNNLDCFVIG